MENNTIPTADMRMDFQNVNSLNVRLNLFSGNLLPMMDRNSSFSLFWKMYSVFVWIIQFIFVIAMILGCYYVPLEKTQSDFIAIGGFIEMCFVMLRIYARKDLIYQLIQKLNEILHIADETMKNVVATTLEPVKAPLNFYWSAGVVSIIAYGCLPFVLIFEKNLFYYEDLNMPAVFSKQPFSFRVFLSANLFSLICNLYCFIRIVGVEAYTIHLILMVTTQYRYIALKIAMIFEEKDEDDNSRTRYFPELYRKKEKEIRALCRYHNDVIHLSILLKELLSLNLNLMYVSRVLRFCFIGILISSITSTTFEKAISIVMFTLSAIVQLYILCSSVQQLLDVSTEITDKAFHGNWYLLQSSAKRIFLFIIMANNLECKVATFKNCNFSLPSFMMILNQSYSIALLFLKIK